MSLISRYSEAYTNTATVLSKILTARFKCAGLSRLTRADAPFEKRPLLFYRCALCTFVERQWPTFLNHPHTLYAFVLRLTFKVSQGVYFVGFPILLRTNKFADWWETQHTRGSIISGWPRNSNGVQGSGSLETTGKFSQRIRNEKLMREKTKIMTFEQRE